MNISGEWWGYNHKRRGNDNTGNNHTYFKMMGNMETIKMLEKHPDKMGWTRDKMVRYLQVPFCYPRICDAHFSGLFVHDMDDSHTFFPLASWEFSQIFILTSSYYHVTKGEWKKLVKILMHSVYGSQSSSSPIVDIFLPNTYTFMVLFQPFRKVLSWLWDPSWSLRGCGLLFSRVVFSILIDDHVVETLIKLASLAYRKAFEAN